MLRFYGDVPTYKLIRDDFQAAEAVQIHVYGLYTGPDKRSEMYMKPAFALRVDVPGQILFFATVSSSLHDGVPSLLDG